MLPIEAYCQTIERNIRELLVRATAACCCGGPPRAIPAGNVPPHVCSLFPAQSRNYDVGQLVRRQALPLGPANSSLVLVAGATSSASEAGGGSGNQFGASAYSSVVVPQQMDDEFGDLMGATAAPGAASPIKGSTLPQRVVALTANSASSGPGAAAMRFGSGRRVRFAEEQHATSDGRPAAGQRDMIEIELGRTAENALLAPPSMPRSNASNWLR